MSFAYDEDDTELIFSARGMECHTPTSTESMASASPKVLVDIVIPEHEWKFVFRVPTNIMVRELLRRVFITCRLDTIEYVNYGLYLPPLGLQKGKFLQEERLLMEYPQLLKVAVNGFQSVDDTDPQSDQSEPSTTLKLIRKVRFIEGLPISHQKFKQVNTKTQQKQFLSAVRNGALHQVDKMLNKGLDPNFQHPITGETPIGMAAIIPSAKEMILLLVEKGSHLEYRDVDTLTPLHRAAMEGNLSGICVLLALGQNPNIRDCRDLTPLYLAVSRDVPTECITRLLYDHAILGVMDDKNRQEIHQACLFNYPRHLEQLIIYGADLDAQTTNLDTPLHICALHDHEECLRLLLRYGARRNILNLSGQTPSDVALLTGLRRLGGIIDKFNDEHVAQITKTPKYNVDKRPSMGGPRAAIEAHQANVEEKREEILRRKKNTQQYRSRTPPFRNSTRTSAPVMGGGHVKSQPMHPRVLQQLPGHRNGAAKRTDFPPNHPVFIKPAENVKTVTLHMENAGFGLQIRGSRSRGLDRISQSGQSMGQNANQFIEDVFSDSPAFHAGLRPGDDILAINGRDVRRASHQEITNLIVESGSRVTVTVCPGINSKQTSHFPRNRENLLVRDRRQVSYRRSVSSSQPEKVIIIRSQDIGGPPPPVSDSPAPPMSSHNLTQTLSQLSLGSDDAHSWDDRKTPISSTVPNTGPRSNVIVIHGRTDESSNRSLEMNAYSQAPSKATSLYGNSVSMIAWNLFPRN